MRVRSLVLATTLLAATQAMALESQPDRQRVCQVVDLRDARGVVKFDLAGTVLLPTAIGEAQIGIKVKKAEAPLTLNVKGLVSPARFGEEYLTYVAWRVLESGNFVSLGELRRDGHKAELDIKVPRGAFGLLVTAEPYFAVPRPSDAVVLSARPTVKAARHLRPVETKCELLPRGHYSMGRSQESLELLFASEVNTPPELLQARNAVDIARLAGAESFSKDRLSEATQKLLRASALLREKGAPRQAAAVANEAVVTAEMARQIALQRAADATDMIGKVDRANKETAAAMAELDQARRESSLEVERREAAEQRLKTELSLRDAMEQHREAQTLVTPPPSFSPSAEKSKLEQERLAVQLEIDSLRAELKAERERMLNETSRQAQTQAELEAARMQLALADERAELKVERARLDAERSLFEARQQRVEPLPATPAPVPTAVPAPVPAPAVVAEPAATPENAELQRLSVELSASQEALTVEQAELRALREELRVGREAALQRETAVAAEPAPLVAAEPPAQEPAVKERQWFGRKNAAKEAAQSAEPVMPTSEAALDEEWSAVRGEQARLDTERAALEAQRLELEALAQQVQTPKKRLWFGRKKAAKETPQPAEPAMAMSDATLDEEWSAVRAEQALLDTERAALASQRLELAALGQPTQPPKKRWWFGSKRSEPVVEPVIVHDSSAAIELSRLEAERAQMRAEVETDRLKLAAERQAFEAEKASQQAERDTAETDQQVVELNQRIAELESAATPVDDEQVELAASVEQLRVELEQIKQAPQESPAWRPDLAQQLGAERTPRGLVVRMPGLSFERSNHELRPEAREQLARVAGILQSAPGAQIEIQGHTDSTGDPAFNLRLSELRAAAVMDYLVLSNLPVEVMHTRGMGDAQPVASNATPEGRSRNRRVELIVTGDDAIVANQRGDHGSE